MLSYLKSVTISFEVLYDYKKLRKTCTFITLQLVLYFTFKRYNTLPEPKSLFLVRINASFDKYYSLRYVQ